MTERMDQVDDADLVAYLDHALPEGRASELEARLADDAALRARLEAMRIDLGALRSEAEDLLAKAPPLPMHRGTAAQLAAAAALALALVLGGVLAGLGLGSGRSDGPQDWRDFAAAYHLLYQPQTLAAPIQGDGGVAMVSDAIGRDLAALAEIEGLDFRRAQILGWQEQPLIQFAYLDATGRPVAVCVMAFDVGPEGMALASEDRHGLATTSFHTDALQILVIGPDGQMDTEALSALVAAQL